MSFISRFAIMIKRSRSTTGKCLFQFESSLPKLPVPKLSETATKYLKSLEPILSKQDLVKTKGFVDDFCNESSIGPILQERLLKRAKDEHRGWLYDYWKKLAYLGYRDSIVINVSYVFGLVDDPRLKYSPKRAAYMISNAWKFKNLIENETLEPEFAGKDALEASSYNWLFNSTRRPAKDCDVAEKFDPEQNQHIIVIRNNHFYKLQMVMSGSVLKPEEIEVQIAKIISEADRNGVLPNVGIFTASHRDVWAEIYIKLLVNNEKILNTIDSAAFVVCLDKEEPVTLEERCRNLLHGNGSDRWFDKPINIIVCDNGVAGYIFEHNSTDGMITKRFSDFLATEIMKADIDPKPILNSDHADLANELQFKLDIFLEQQIEFLQQYHNQRIQNFDLKVLKYQRYGKEHIKAFGCSPDAFAQLILQLGYYKMYGTNRPTYETAATRRFAFGRTETIRSLTTEIVDFCEAFESNECSSARKIELARAAIQRHSATTKDSSLAQGVDRHLMGLKLMLKDDEPIPDLFKDAAYSESAHWYLSTSQIASENHTAFSYGPVVDDGYGIPYQVNKYHLYFAPACWSNKYPKYSKIKTDASKFAYYISEAADGLYELFHQNLTLKAKL